MSADRSTEEVVARLVDAAEPVRPVAALRWQLLGVVGIWLATAAFVALLLGLHPLAAFERDAISAGVEIALLVLGFAGLTMALAARIPGRERLTRGAAGGIALGIGVVGIVALGLPGWAAGPGFVAQCLNCGSHALLLAIPSGAIAMLLALRGAGWHAALAGLGIATGAAALGALLIHMSCPSPDPWHWLIAHLLLPLGAGVPIGLAVAWVLDRVARRSARTAAARLAS